jgi:hypothetical protein
VADCCLLFYWLQSNVITGLPLPSLSCGPATLPTKIKSNSNPLPRHHSASSPTLLGTRSLFLGRHRSLLGTHPIGSIVSYCWCFSFVCSNHSFLHRCCFFLVVVRSLVDPQLILNSRSSFAYLSRRITCHGLMVSLVVSSSPPNSLLQLHSRGQSSRGV